MDSLLRKSDFVSVHVPLLPSTKGIINKGFLKNMRKDSVLLNLSRGDVMNEEDVLKHLDVNPDFWLGIDTHVNEPKISKGTFTSKLA